MIWPSVALAGILILTAPRAAEAYVGPGAGFVFVSSFAVLFVTALMALFSMLLWPFRTAWRLLRRGRRPRPRIRRLIVVGFDGQDPGLTDRFLREGKLPNFGRLAEEGCYHRLTSTFPSVSPVAWSSFSTGTHPAKHNIFDFIDRDWRTYLPVLSSTRIGRPDRVLRLGRYRIPLGSPPIRLLRKSRPFWSILGDHEIWSTILRVPISFPPERFHGAQLAAMCVPDLLGTQGTFTLFTTRKEQGAFKEGGARVTLDGNGTHFRTSIKGPDNDLVEGSPPMEIPLVIDLDRGGSVAHVKVGDADMELSVGELSDWIELEFPAAPLVRVRGVCRMMVTEMADHFSLYLTPINLDPEKPAMPISHPSYFGTYLAKRIGKYATLGLAEDTWALNEGVIGDDAFLRQTYDIDGERQGMFFTTLDRQRSGAVVCVFDATDRIQHMFWRLMGRDGPGETEDDPIAELYRHNDRMLGKVLDRLREGDLLMVLSDHGFTSFRRGINLNAWLHRHGYLTLKAGGDGSAEWLRDVDWSRTRAYAMGLTGMFLNLKGREGRGIVEPGADADALKTELIRELSGLKDDDSGDIAIREMFDTSALYSGPYLRNGPDLLIGCNAGYRVSWDGATGVVAGPVIDDNTKAWSGDHCVDPRLVPGVFFCNRPIEREDPALIDIAPSVLQLFGLEVPGHMDGHPLFVNGDGRSQARSEPATAYPGGLK